MLGIFFRSVVAFNCNNSNRKSWWGILLVPPTRQRVVVLEIWSLPKSKLQSFVYLIYCMLCWPPCVHVQMYLQWFCNVYRCVSMSHENQYEVAKAHLRRKGCVTRTVLQTAPCQQARRISNLAELWRAALGCYDLCMYELLMTYIYIYISEWFLWCLRNCSFGSIA